MTLAEIIDQFVPSGFRDDDGVWHDGPLRAKAADELDRLRWTIVELASHVHDCEDLLSPRSRRTVSEVRAAQLARVTDSQAAPDVYRPVSDGSDEGAPA